MQRDLLFLAEMIEAAEQIQQLVVGLDLAALEADRQRRDALLWNFTVLGEAATRLDPATKQRFPAVPWAEPARMRNRVVHGYWTVDLEILHTAAVSDIPPFLGQLRTALAALEADEDPSEP